MTAATKLHVTPEEYLARERQAEFKSEYYDGEIFAMAGGSPEEFAAFIRDDVAKWVRVAGAAGLAR